MAVDCVLEGNCEIFICAGDVVVLIHHHSELLERCYLKSGSFQIGYGGFCQIGYYGIVIAAGARNSRKHVGSAGEMVVSFSGAFCHTAQNLFCFLIVLVVVIIFAEVQAPVE